MKTIFLKVLGAFVLTLSSITSYSQITVNGSDGCPAQKLSDKEFQKLKESTVYFVAKDNMITDKEAFAKMLKDNWKYSKIELINETELSTYFHNEGASFFSVSYSMTNGSFTDAYYELWNLKDPKKDFGLNNMNKIVYANFVVELDCKTLSKIKKASGKAIGDIMAKPYTLINFLPGIVANNLRIINKSLKAKTAICDKRSISTDELKNLALDTLFIVESFFVKKDPFNGKCKGQDLDASDIMSDYEYTYKIISLEELSRKLLEDEIFYYYLFIPESFSFDIYSSNSEIIFRTNACSPEGRKRDIKDLAKAIAKKLKK